MYLLYSPGALRCLIEGGGDVAFVRHSTVAETAGGRRREWWARNTLRDDFQLLCPDGKYKICRANLSNLTSFCGWRVHERDAVPCNIHVPLGNCRMDTLRQPSLTHIYKHSYLTLNCNWLEHFYQFLWVFDWKDFRHSAIFYLFPFLARRVRKRIIMEEF